MNQAILKSLQVLKDEDLRGCLIIVEPGRMRLRRKS
jgi:hypothetical protein